VLGGEVSGLTLLGLHCYCGQVPPVYWFWRAAATMNGVRSEERAFLVFFAERGQDKNTERIVFVEQTTRLMGHGDC
jgi:hypothetical protein